MGVCVCVDGGGGRAGGRCERDKEGVGHVGHFQHVCRCVGQSLWAPLDSIHLALSLFSFSSVSLSLSLSLLSFALSPSISFFPFVSLFSFYLQTISARSPKGETWRPLFGCLLRLCSFPASFSFFFLSFSSFLSASIVPLVRLTFPPLIYPVVPRCGTPICQVLKRARWLLRGLVRGPLAVWSDGQLLLRKQVRTVMWPCAVAVCVVSVCAVTVCAVTSCCDCVLCASSFCANMCGLCPSCVAFFLCAAYSVCCDDVQWTVLRLFAVTVYGGCVMRLHAIDVRYGCGNRCGLHRPWVCQGVFWGGFVL